MKKYIFIFLFLSNNAFAGCKYFNIDGSKSRIFSDGMICQLPQNPKCFAMNTYHNHKIINCDPELTILYNNLS